MPLHMSRKCEKLLRKFLLLNSSKKGTLEPIQKDPWKNTGHEDELKPSVGPLSDYQEPWPTELMVSMCDNMEEIQGSLMARSTTK
ncbi:hypothetical protein J1605_005034 [Eschrichtius robustus]|uniref:Uncharacterized protein n=1 Tax=Eschrichtius robustus TaxID=9764 RepID=A0AB34H9V3_ESCRO|nr:hypothetical protein J1605_005034 [Eschrichtius robustus]